MDWNRIRIPVSRSLWISELVSRLACAVLLDALAPAGHANTVVFATGPQMLAVYAEHAQATFDINNTTHTITVHLLNLQINPSDVDQAIGSLRFTLTGAGTPVRNSTLTGISDNRLSGRDTTPDFTITFPALTNLSSVVITNVIFGFGEDANYGWNSITVPVETPEPDAAILFGTGLCLIAVAVGARHFRRH
jgi:hypothetical protein